MLQKIGNGSEVGLTSLHGSPAFQKDVLLSGFYADEMCSSVGCTAERQGLVMAGRTMLKRIARAELRDVLKIPRAV